MKFSDSSLWMSEGSASAPSVMLWAERWWQGSRKHLETWRFAWLMGVYMCVHCDVVLGNNSFIEAGHISACQDMCLDTRASFCQCSHADRKVLLSSQSDRCTAGVSPSCWDRQQVEEGGVLGDRIDWPPSLCPFCFFFLVAGVLHWTFRKS